MTEQGVYKTIVQFPLFPVPLAPGRECWQPSFDVIRPQPCNKHVRLAVNVAFSRLVREGRKSLKGRSVHMYKQPQLKRHLFSGKCIDSIHSLPSTTRRPVTT